ncbi:MAG: hypothetical protein ACK5M3_16680 [Dysgonomonas sp.]
MKKILIILLSLFFTLMICAQRNYREGYVLTSQNDTLRGWVDFRSDKQNSTICTFKSDPTGQEQEFHPKDIYGYRYLNDGKFYVSQEIEIDGIKKTVFLEFLLAGIENLYYYREGDVKYYILENMKGDFLYTSQEPERKIFTNNGDRYVKDLKYIGVLKYYFKDHPEIQKEVDQTQYNHESMIKLVKTYHDLVCTSDQLCTVFESKSIHDKYKTKISVYIGYNHLSGYKLNSENGVFFENKMDENYPVIGVQTSFYLPRISQLFSLDLDASFSTLKGEDIGRDKTYNISSLVGFFKVGPGYTSCKGRVRPTVQTGFTLLKIFDPAIEITDHESGTKDNYLGEIKSTGLGFYLSAGIDFKTVRDSFLFIKVTYDKYFTDIKNSNLSYIGARIGYTF